MNCERKSDIEKPDLKAILSSKIDGIGSSLWLKDCDLSLAGETLDVIFKSSSSMNFVKQKYQGLIKNLGMDFGCSSVAFKIQKSENKVEKNIESANVIEFKKPKALDFIEDDCNKAAFATMNYIIENRHASLLDGKILHIWGEKSCGKTAILKYFLSEIGSENCIMFQAIEFINLYSNAVKSNNLLEFRNNILSKKFLIIDDLHLLAGQKGTLLEIMKTSSLFQDASKTIITASSLEISAMPSDILSGIKNFSSALSTKILTTSFSLKTKLASSLIPGETLEKYEKIAKSAKSLNDIKSLTTQIKLGGSENLSLFETFENESESGDFEKIIKAVEGYFKLKAGILTRKSGGHAAAHARYVTIYILRKNTNMTMSQIASILGFRSHASIVRAVKKLDNNEHTITLQIITDIESLLK